MCYTRTACSEQVRAVVCLIFATLLSSYTYTHFHPSTPVDVIVAVNGRRVETLSSFVAELDKVGIDNLAELTVQSGKKERKVRVKVVDVGR